MCKVDRLSYRALSRGVASATLVSERACDHVRVSLLRAF
jgi:hypothetical protein